MISIAHGGKIINHVGLTVSLIIKAREMPSEKPILHRDKSSIVWNYVWNYCAGVIMLSCILRSIEPEISIAVNQCAFFFNNTRLVHKRAIRGIANYLTITSTYVNLPDRNWQLTTWSIVYIPIYKRLLVLRRCQLFWWMGSGRCWQCIKLHVLYGVCNIVRGISSIMMQ